MRTLRSRATAVLATLLAATWMGCTAHPAGHKFAGTSPGTSVAAQHSAGPLVVVPLGLCEDYPEESRSLAEVRRDLQLLKRTGVEVLRVSIGWDGVEPERNRYELGFWDAFFEETAAAGIRIIPYVAYTPRWNARSQGADYWKQPPVDLDEFTELMALLAGRFHARVASWEIWNEPDNADFWLGSASDYAALLMAGARGVKAGAPDAKVVLGGIAGHPEFATRVLAISGVAPLVDVVNAHAYFETWNPDPLEALPRYVEAFSPALTRPPNPRGTAGSRPLWLAEVGYSDFRSAGTTAARPVYAYEHTPAFQAVMLVRTAALVLARPEVQLFAWYEVKDPAAGAPMIGDDNNRHLGVVASDRTPKPALSALALVTRLFGAGFRRLDGTLRVTRAPGSKAEAHAFLSAAGHAVIVAWLPTTVPSVGATSTGDGRVERIDVELPFVATGPAVRLDAEGSVRERLAADGAGGPPGQRLRISRVTLAGGEVAVLEIPVTAP